MHPMVTVSANIAHVVNLIIIIHYAVVLSILEIHQNLASHLVGSKKDAQDLLVQYGVVLAGVLGK